MSRKSVVIFLAAAMFSFSTVAGAADIVAVEQTCLSTNDDYFVPNGGNLVFDACPNCITSDTEIETGAMGCRVDCPAGYVALSAEAYGEYRPRDNLPIFEVSSYKTDQFFTRGLNTSSVELQQYEYTYNSITLEFGLEEFAIEALAMCVSLDGEGSSSSDAPVVNGNRIEWTGEGWWQVQNADDYTEICGGTAYCDVPAGTYIVINHTTGTRYTDIVVGAVD